jgi:hypothetical protein
MCEGTTLGHFREQFSSLNCRQVSFLVGGSVSAGMVRSSVLLNKCDDLSAIYHLLQASNTQQAILNFPFESLKGMSHEIDFVWLALGLIRGRGHF